MFKKLTYFVFLFLISFSCFAWDGNDNIMLWQVNPTGNTVDDGPNDVYTFLGFDHANDDIGVRIAAYDKDGNLIKYLNPVYPEEFAGVDWEYNDEYIGTRDDLPASTRQAYYGGEDYTERLFQMQVGNYDGDGNFMPLLWTRGESIPGKYWYDSGTLLPPGFEWAPTKFYTANPVIPDIPEPNSFILLSLGICLLGLRRKSP